MMCGGVDSRWFQTQLILTVCQICYHSHFVGSSPPPPPPPPCENNTRVRTAGGVSAISGTMENCVSIFWSLMNIKFLHNVNEDPHQSFLHQNRNGWLLTFIYIFFDRFSALQCPICSVSHPWARCNNECRPSSKDMINTTSIVFLPCMQTTQV